jgi:hypothetical protein
VGDRRLHARRGREDVATLRDADVHELTGRICQYDADRGPIEVNGQLVEHRVRGPDEPLVAVFARRDVSAGLSARPCR